MDEVDSIIIHTLLDVGCDFDEDIKLKNLTPEEIYKSLQILCKIINPELDIKTTLPTQMSQRFATATILVESCKSLGFKGDFGYQTILYSNINELRRVFMWLIENLPKSEDKTDSYQDSGSVSKAKAIENEIFRKLAVDLKKPWLLSFLQKPTGISIKPEELEVPHSNNDYGKFYLPPIFHQTRNLIPSLLLTNEKALMRKAADDSSEISKKLRNTLSTQSFNLISSPSRSTISSLPSVAEKAEVTESAPISKSRLEILSEKVEILKDSIDTQEDIFRQLSVEQKEISKSIEAEKKIIEKSKKDNKLKMQVAMLLDNPEESIEKLKKSLDVARAKRETLNEKFISHKEPLEEHLATFSGTNAIKLQKIQERRENVKNIKRAIGEIHEDMKVKVQLQQVLQAELSKKKRSIAERTAYTSRIDDIIKSIKKQNYDINEVLKDTKMLQKDINKIQGQLQRQFVVTEELVWTKTEKQDEYSKKAYKLLINLHTEFSELISLIESTGSIQREIRELEDQIDNERQQNVQQKLVQILRDLELMTADDESAGKS